MSENLRDIFIKGYWDEENIMFYFHFQSNRAVRQIENHRDKAIYLSVENPFDAESMLYDKSLEDMETDGLDFITQAEFETEWKKQFVS